MASAVERTTPRGGVHLSVVIPARNEASRLPATLRAVAGLASPDRIVEVVIADDGSIDDTAALARAAAPGLQLSVLRLKARGPGVAARAGVLAACGERILLCDADGAVPFTDIAPLWHALDCGYDLAVGCRTPALLLSPRPALRRLLGRTWRFLGRRLAPTAVRDTQCGFKLFSRRAARSVFWQLRSRSFAFHLEALLIAERLGLRTAEVPVSFCDVPHSRVRLWRDPPHMLWDLLRLGLRMQVPIVLRGKPPSLSAGVEVE